MLYDFGDGKGLVDAAFHRNGGGIIASTAKVDPTVFIDRECVVFGHAQIKNRVRVVGHCRISGELLPGSLSTLIEDDVFISGNVVIEGHVLMRDRSQARNFAKLSDAVAMMHDSRVVDRATVAGQVQLRDHSYVREDATIIGKKELLILSAYDLVGGSSILRTVEDLDLITGKFNKKRRVNRKVQAPMDRPRSSQQISLTRRMSVMPTLEDLQAISLNSEPENRIAAVG